LFDCPAFFWDCYTLEDGIDRMSGNIDKKATNPFCVTSQKSEGLSYTAAEAWNLAYTSQHLLIVNLSFGSHRE
jgi:hypothetical protein